MTTFRIGLRPRFLLAMLALVLVVFGGFYYAVSQFLDVLENDMTHGQMRRDMARIVQLYQYDPKLITDVETGLEVFVRPRGETAGLPTDIARLEDGQAHEVRIAGKDYEQEAMRRDIGDTSLYLVMDLTPVERLEAELVTVAWIAGLGALFLAVVLALWLSHLITKPVRRLAREVARIEPGQDRPKLAIGMGDRELDTIAQVLDTVLDRFDAFVAREQAFTEDASHELRTPLAVAISSIDLIAGDASLSEKTRRRLVRARSATDRMHELIESLLLFAREQADDDLCTAVSPVIRESIAMQQAAAPHLHGCTPEIVFEVHAEHWVAAPPSILLSVVNNLLRNALEHGGAGRIDVSLDGGCLCIRDHGQGMAPAVLSRLFDRRFRGPHSAGQGIGLYLVKRISERFGWRIRVDSEPGVGTRFDLEFEPA